MREMYQTSPGKKAMELIPAENGGWLVTTSPENGIRGKLLAAVSNSADLLEWLADNLDAET